MKERIILKHSNLWGSALNLFLHDVMYCRDEFAACKLKWATRVSNVLLISDRFNFTRLSSTRLDESAELFRSRVRWNARNRYSWSSLSDAENTRSTNSCRRSSKLPGKLLFPSFAVSAGTEKSYFFPAALWRAARTRTKIRWETGN